MKLNYSCETCVNKGDSTGKCGNCTTSFDVETGQHTVPTNYKRKKDCSNCKYLGRDGFSFPCSDCADDEDGKPNHWEEITKVEEINHPQRYKHGEYECIDVMVDVFGKEAVEHFCLLSAFKYVWRKDYKGGIQDIKKAMWYLDKYLELEGVDHA